MSDLKIEKLEPNYKDVWIFVQAYLNIKRYPDLIEIYDSLNAAGIQYKPFWVVPKSSNIKHKI